MSQQRFFLLDLLKGLAIFAVVLYHLGLFEYGYLGVEIFLVVSGFLTTKSVVGAFTIAKGRLAMDIFSSSALCACSRLLCSCAHALLLSPISCSCQTILRTHVRQR